MKGLEARLRGGPALCPCAFFYRLFVTQYYPAHPLAAGWVCVTLFLPGRRGVLIPLRCGLAAGPPRFVLVVWPAGAVGAVDDLKGESLDGPPDGADDEVEDHKDTDKEK